MKITRSTVNKVCIQDIQNLDTINVFIEDFRPGVGRIIIECFGESWASAWGGIGGNKNMEQFFCSCNSQYLIGKLAPQLESKVPANEGLINHLKKIIVERRQDDEISKKNARKWYKMADDVPDDADSRYLGEESDFPIDEVLGDEWWYCLPKIPNHKYEYLKRIVAAVQSALKESEEK